MELTLQFPFYLCQFYDTEADPGCVKYAEWPKTAQVPNAEISVLGFPEQRKVLEMQLETSVHVLRAHRILWMGGLA